MIRKALNIRERTLTLTTIESIETFCKTIEKCIQSINISKKMRKSVIICGQHQILDKKSKKDSLYRRD